MSNLTESYDSLEDSSSADRILENLNGATADEGPGNSRKVLVIDDEAHIRLVLELNLKAQGYQVITAADGEEGLHLIETEKPDVVISDINMPKMNGQIFCEMASPMKAENPFLTVIITGRIAADESWVSDLQDAMFMEKPFSLSKLYDSIDQYFEEHR